MNQMHMDESWMNQMHMDKSWKIQMHMEKEQNVMESYEKEKKRIFHFSLQVVIWFQYFSINMDTSWRRRKEEERGEQEGHQRGEEFIFNSGFYCSYFVIFFLSMCN